MKLAVLHKNINPFGLRHNGYNQQKQVDGKFKYKYNGKELQDELGLQWYDYGARNYDAALGRFMNLDPLTEKYNTQSPYVYADNNPVLFKDILGMGTEDTYKLTKNGEIKKVDDKKYYDKNGNEVDKLIAEKNGKSTMVKKGVLNKIKHHKLKNVKVKVGKNKHEKKIQQPQKLKYKVIKMEKNYLNLLQIIVMLNGHI